MEYDWRLELEAMNDNNPVEKWDGGCTRIVTGTTVQIRPLAFFCTESRIKWLCRERPEVSEETMRKFIHLAIEAKQISVWNERPGLACDMNWSWKIE